MIVAQRSLKLRQNGRQVEVPVRIHAPECKGPDWSCKYEIGWPQETREGYAAGVDSMQALVFALAKIGVDLYNSHFHESGELMWEEAGSGYGFPVPQNLRDVLIGDDAKFL